jgi:hypothetical protein
MLQQFSYDMTSQVWDYDTFSADDFVGVIRLKMKDAAEIPLAARNANAAPVPPPQWYPLRAPSGTRLQQLNTSNAHVIETMLFMYLNCRRGHNWAAAA